MKQALAATAVILFVAGCEAAPTGTGGVGGAGGAGGAGGEGGGAERPVAIASLVTRNPDPLERVTLDGSQSYSDITDYLWEVVEMPETADPADFAPEGQGTATFSFP